MWFYSFSLVECFSPLAAARRGALIILPLHYGSHRVETLAEESLAVKAKLYPLKSGSELLN